MDATASAPDSPGSHTVKDATASSPGSASRTAKPANLASSHPVVEEYDGRWPWPKSPKPKPRTPSSPSRSLRGSLSSGSLSPVASGIRRDSPPGPIYDLDGAGGSRMSMTQCINFFELRHSAMREGSAPRFPSRSDGNPGPGHYPTRPTIGPQALGRALSGEGRSPKKADCIFRSQQLRVPEDSNGWLIIRSRNSELNAETMETDDRERFVKFNGQLKGASFKGSARKFMLS
eukprot:TRINITY_DN95575_c0_g1_i1.p1 TRINITY_DN95575_c0_g1~~TRINITY_DN95575_c0_g1_i1.p1  ORF type:complete len:232 (+),score=26.24 TRINITY_DN95575_c0_g1_i1:53-748(+)